MNGYRKQEGLQVCYLHPNEVVVGVCAFCLNERLLILASKKRRSSTTSRHRCSSSSTATTTQTTIYRNSQAIILSKIFTFTSLLTRRSRNSEISDHGASTSSQEESFISMKFEENGVGSWEKNKVTSKVTLENCSMAWKNHNLMINKEGSAAKDQTKSVIEHGKSGVALRTWRKRFGHLSQLIRWKRSKKVVEGVKVRNHKGNWIRNISKTKTI